MHKKIDFFLLLKIHKILCKTQNFCPHLIGLFITVNEFKKMS